jgi:hypothetical protein
MPALIRHPEALDSGFRRNDGASDNNETVNNSPLPEGFRSPFENLRVSGIPFVAMMLPLMLRLSKHER